MQWYWPVQGQCSENLLLCSISMIISVIFSCNSRVVHVQMGKNAIFLCRCQTISSVGQYSAESAMLANAALDLQLSSHSEITATAMQMVLISSPAVGRRSSSIHIFSGNSCEQKYAKRIYASSKHIS